MSFAQRGIAQSRQSTNGPVSAVGAPASHRRPGLSPEDSCSFVAPGTHRLSTVGVARAHPACLYRLPAHITTPNEATLCASTGLPNAKIRDYIRCKGAGPTGQLTLFNNLTRRPRGHVHVATMVSSNRDA